MPWPFSRKAHRQDREKAQGAFGEHSRATHGLENATRGSGGAPFLQSTSVILLARFHPLLLVGLLGQGRTSANGLIDAGTTGDASSPSSSRSRSRTSVPPPQVTLGSPRKGLSVFGTSALSCV